MAQTYSISVPDQKLAELKDKLASATFPDELEDAGWDYGTPLQDVKRLAAYWKDGYDWRKHEADLNLLPNFMNSIDINGFEALDIHFVHRESDVKGAIPLLFVHGCKVVPFDHLRKRQILTATRARKFHRSYEAAGIVDGRG